MAVDLSVKQVPEDVADRLRERARRHHRSLQGELRAILDLAANEYDASMPSVIREKMATHEPTLGSRGRIVAPQSESALVVHEDRDGRRLTIDDLFERVSSIGAAVAGGIAPDDADEMRKIVEDEFERVDHHEWR